MNDLGALIAAVLDLFKTEFSVYGFTMSFWQLFLWGLVASIVITFVWRLFE